MKLSDLTDEEWFERLQRRRFTQIPLIRAWWEYYDGCQPLYYIAQILAEQDDRFPPLLINWCEKFVDTIDRRMIVEGFRLGGADEQDAQLREIWQRNDLDEHQSAVNVASLVTGQGYAMIGPDDDGKALVTIEEPDSVAVELDPRTGRVIAGLKVWRSDPEMVAMEDRAVLLVPGRVVEFEDQKATSSTPQKWMAAPAKLQTSPMVPLVPFFNRYRPRTSWDLVTGWNGYGRSELRSLKRIVDAANQVATNMMAAVEHHAVPRKWALGVAKDQFIDPATGDPLPAWKIATGAIWANPYDEENPDAKPQVGQFPASDLRNFHDTISLLGRLAAGVCDMPPSEFGFGVADNPPGADSIRAAREAFTARCEQLNIQRGTPWERTMRIAGAVEGIDPAKTLRMETVQRDPGVPTQQAKSQVAIANYESGLSDLHQARIDYGYTATTIEAMEKREKDNPPPPRAPIPAPAPSNPMVRPPH